MLERFYALSPGQIALVAGLATLISAVIAFVASLTVALVNAQAARHTGLIAERRQYRLARLKPFLEFAQGRVAASTKLNYYIVHKQWDSARQTLAGMEEVSWLQFSSALGIALADYELDTISQKLIEAEQSCRKHASEIINHDGVGIDYRAFGESRMTLATQADLLHDIAEVVVFDLDRWGRRLRRAKRFIKSKRKDKE